MIIRTLKLKLTKRQEAQCLDWLNCLTSVYNWGLRKIELNAANKVYFSKLKFQNLLADHGKRLGIPSHTIQGTLQQVYDAWQRCFRKQAKKPRLKGRRNRLSSIPFPDPIRAPTDGRVTLVGIGKVKYHKQDLPDVKIRCGRIVRRASGWYLCLWLDTEHKFAVKPTTKAVGIDPGFSSLLTLSDGTKVENPKELRKGAKRLAQAQRGHNGHLVSRLLERQKNRRADRNHKITRWLAVNYATICYSDDNFKRMARNGFGKSVSETALGNLIGMLGYKCRTGGRTLVPVKSNFTTTTCSACGALTGPTGRGGLAVRHWRCSACGADHDRDVNSAVVVLSAGLGASHGRGRRHV